MIECAHDVAMIELLDRDELAFEPRHRVGRSYELEVQQLDRDVTIVGAQRTPHLTESAFTDQTIDAIAGDHGSRSCRRYERFHGAAVSRAPVAVTTHSSVTTIVTRLLRVSRRVSSYLFRRQSYIDSSVGKTARNSALRRDHTGSVRASIDSSTRCASSSPATRTTSAPSSSRS